MSSQNRIDILFIFAFHPVDFPSFALPCDHINACWSKKKWRQAFSIIFFHPNSLTFLIALHPSASACLASPHVSSWGISSQNWVRESVILCSLSGAQRWQWNDPWCHRAAPGLLNGGTRQRINAFIISELLTNSCHNRLGIDKHQEEPAAHRRGILFDIGPNDLILVLSSSQGIPPRFHWPATDHGMALWAQSYLWALDPRGFCLQQIGQKYGRKWPVEGNFSVLWHCSFLQLAVQVLGCCPIMACCTFPAALACLTLSPKYSWCTANPAIAPWRSCNTFGLQIHPYTATGTMRKMQISPGISQKEWGWGNGSGHHLQSRSLRSVVLLFVCQFTNLAVPFAPQQVIIWFSAVYSL